MICTVIQHKTAREIGEILRNGEMAEIRLDRCVLDDSDIDGIFESDVPLVATCRVSEVLSANPEMTETAAATVCERKLCRAIEAGARYVDVEIEAPKYMSKRVRACARENGTVFIRSYHDFEGTDSVEALKAIVEKCFYHGADIVKIVTTARSGTDAERVMSLYGEFGRGKLIAFCMGEAGVQSRMDCLAEGAPYTYAALDGADPAAPGQRTAAAMREELYGKFNCVEAVLTVPSSKSFAQRAVMAAALAEGISELDGYSPCGDNGSAIEAAKALGAEVNIDGSRVRIKGIGAVPLKASFHELHVGESGLLTRLMIPLLSMLSSSPVTITGEKTLTGRPMTGVTEIMSEFGVSVTSESGDCRVPLTVSGPMRSGRAEISGKNGSQLISGLLMSLPLADRNSSLIVREPKSIPYMFITLDVLKKFGIKVSAEMLGGRDFMEHEGDWAHCTEMVFKIRGGQRYRSADFHIEGDWSSAANFLVAGAVFGKVTLEGLDTTSLQADISIMDILMEAGASLSQLDEPKGPVTVQRAPLSAFTVDATNCPDLFPIVSVLAAFCEGRSRIAGVGRLAHKESDRGKAILDMLHKMGVEADVEGDELVIVGQSLSSRLLSGNLLRGGEYTSCHDHRMVMALKVAELGASSPIIIDDTACVAKSFPSFMHLFEELKK